MQREKIAPKTGENEVSAIFIHHDDVDFLWVHFPPPSIPIPEEKFSGCKLDA